VKTLEVIALVVRSSILAFHHQPAVRYANAKGWQITARVVENDPEVEEGGLPRRPRRTGLRQTVRATSATHYNKPQSSTVSETWVTTTSMADQV